MVTIWLFSKKLLFKGVPGGFYHRIIQKLLELELSLKICYSGTFWQGTFYKLLPVSICCCFGDMADFCMPKISKKNWTVQVIVIKFGRTVLHINTMNRAENRHSQPKNGWLMTIFYFLATNILKVTACLYLLLFIHASVMNPNYFIGG